MVLFLLALNVVLSAAALFYVWRAARSQRRLIEMWMNARQAEYIQVSDSLSRLNEEMSWLRHRQRMEPPDFGETLNALSRLIRRPDLPTIPSPPVMTAHERLMKDDD